MMKQRIAAAALVGVLSLLTAGLPRAQQADPQAQAQAESAALQQLAPFALLTNGKFYTRFEISQGAPPAPQGGFAAPLTPQGAPLVANGIMEVTPYSSWSITLFADQNGGVSGVASLRLFQYRAYDFASGRWTQNLLPLHMWEWNVRVDASGARAAPKMDQTNFPTDNGARELVASIYNVPPDGVAVAAPDASLVAQVFAAGQQSSGPPQRRACRACETQQPDGGCRQWRACM